MPLYFIIYLVTMFWNIDKELKISKIIIVVRPPHRARDNLWHANAQILFLIIYPFLSF